MLVSIGRSQAYKILVVLHRYSGIRIGYQILAKDIGISYQQYSSKCILATNFFFTFVGNGEKVVKLCTER